MDIIRRELFDVLMEIRYMRSRLDGMGYKRRDHTIPFPGINPQIKKGTRGVVHVG